MRRAGRRYASGEARAPALVLSEPLSFWGGVDVATGDIIDHSHSGLGKNVAGRVLVMPSGRGSSSSSSVLAEAIRRGTGPVAIVMAKPDPILTVAAIVALTLYGLRCPIVVCEIEGIATGDDICVSAPEASETMVEIIARGNAGERRTEAARP